LHNIPDAKQDLQFEDVDWRYVNQGKVKLKGKGHDLLKKWKEKNK